MKLKKTQIIFIIILTLITVLFVGCTPSEDPKAFMESYYQNTINNNFESAYDKLSSVTQNNFSKDDFILFQTLLDESSQLKSVSVELISESKNKDLDGNTFKNAIEFKVTETAFEYYYNQEKTNSYTRYVVNENGKWKIYRGGENGKNSIAYAYEMIGYMYNDGKGKEHDYNKAAMQFKKGIEASGDYIYNYYALARCYAELDRYSEAQTQIDLYLQKATDPIELSDGYNVKGVIYLRSDNYTQAKNMFKKALELNPNNEYAKSNLNYLK